jgi:ATP-dependent Clp protease, protease subunit
MSKKITGTESSKQIRKITKIFLEGEITDSTFSEIFQSIEEVKWIKSREKIIRIYIDSPGGYVSYGQTICDYLESLKKEGFIIETVATTIVASMAFAVFMAGDRRYMYDTAYLMQHLAILSGSCMDVAEMQETLKTIDVQDQWLLEYTSNKSKISKNDFNDIINNGFNREKYFNKLECLRYGFITHEELPEPRPGKIINIFPEDKPSNGIFG